MASSLSQDSYVQQFRDTLIAAGLHPPDHIEPGELTRCPSNGKHGDDAGWFRLFDDCLGGVYGDWRTGLDEHWQAKRDRPYTPQERAAFQRRVDAERRKREAEDARRHAEAARKAAALWKAGTPARDDHPYLMRKQVSPVESLRELPAEAVTETLGYTSKSSGEPLTGRLLLVPIKVGGKLSTLELIDELGRKSALAGGVKKAGFWAPQLPDGKDYDGVLCLGEGVATVLSVYEATFHPVVAAFSCGNLHPVAHALRKRHPHARLVILADLGNGQRHAEEAARAIGGVCAVPDFGDDRPDGATDFNDLSTHLGLDAVSEVIEAALRTCSSIKNGVTGVTGVTAYDANDSEADSGVTPGVTGVTDGVTGSPVSGPIPGINERPLFRVLDDWVETSARKYRPGVWFFGVKHRKSENSEPVLVEDWICSPLHVEAVTADTQGNNYGRLLRFRTTRGHWREWAMPMELLAGKGDELRGELLAMGVEIDPLSKTLLAQYLTCQHPESHALCATQVGWHGQVFVLPDATLGEDAGAVVFQSGERGHEEYTLAGTLEGWQREVAARAVGNPMLMLTLSAGFAGPLMKPCHAESGGLHFLDDSSVGKTGLVRAACSLWGGEGYLRSWNTTANGLEGVAALFNDGLLALDEISECDPREIGKMLYALGNGVGKQRANRYGHARSVTRWRCIVLSSGEQTLATHMLLAGSRAKAGQSVRMLDVPARRRFGVWDELHGLASGAAFTDALKQAATTHYGHAGRAFLEKLTREERNLAEIFELMKGQPEFSADSGQEKRASARFALMALAGELATEYGMTGWKEGDALDAAILGFQAWRSQRTAKSKEQGDVLQAVSDFIELHGDSRFSDADTDADALRIQRAGWWRDAEGERVYLFTGAGLREALKGFDFPRALEVLREHGVLSPQKDGKSAGRVRIHGRQHRLYEIRSGRLEV